MPQITSRTYDEHVLHHGAGAHVDIYYEPKKPEDRRRIDIVLGHLCLQQGERVLDVGSGVGTFAFHGAKVGAVTVGADYSLSTDG
jgi:cyclopropane fatty-acyl-phospholipid synthase-like methyltransferase